MCSATCNKQTHDLLQIVGLDPNAVQSRFASYSSLKFPSSEVSGITLNFTSKNITLQKEMKKKHHSRLPKPQNNYYLV